MQITKLEHSGIIVDKNGQKIVCDPVEFMHKLPELTNVVAIIITHQHSDHFQPEILARILEQNPEARIFAPRDLEIDEIAGRPIEKVENGAIQEISNFKLRFFGQNHAAIVPGIVPCSNTGVIIDEIVVNPGDSFDLPTSFEHPKVLFVPSAAPWCKVSESAEYIKKARPEIAIPFHNAVLSDLGNGINNNWLAKVADEVDTKFAPLQPGESIELE